MKLSKDYVVLLAILFVIAMWLLTPSLVRALTPTGSTASSNDLNAARGQYGDMYGYVTSLFSGITIVGLVYTIILQREDIRLSRQSVIKQAEELELTKEALINQQQEIRDNRTEIIQNREEIKRQHQTVKYQRFENTFFNMLTLLSGVKNKMNPKVTENLVAHISVMVMQRNKASYKETYSLRIVQQINTELELIRNFEKTADLIYKEKEKEGNRKKYFGILCAQLTPDDLCVIYFHFLALALPPEYFNEYRASLLSELEAVGSRHTPYIELIKDIENGKL